MIRRRALREFQGLVTRYFDQSSLNLMTGIHRESEDARKAREDIHRMMNNVYSVIRRADINPRGASTASFAARGHDRNIDLILNIFNLGRNDIPSQAAIDYIEQAADVYKADRLSALIRTFSPFYWVGRLLRLMKGRKRQPHPGGQPNRIIRDELRSNGCKSKIQGVE